MQTRSSVFDGIDDLLIAGAAAQVAADGFTYIRFARLRNGRGAVRALRSACRVCNTRIAVRAYGRSYPAMRLASHLHCKALRQVVTR
jgi:hypothetical protein